MSGQTWTPAPKHGIIPLHPLTFGTLLGKSFAALRHNPQVLFGFAVVVQLVISVITSVVMTIVLALTFTRLESVSFSSPDFGAIWAGTIAINGLVGLGLSLVSVAFTAMMQGVVAADVASAALGRKATFALLWRKMAAAFWRLVGFALLQTAALFALIAIVIAIIAAVLLGASGSSSSVGIGVLFVVLIVLAAIPVAVWLSTKLLLVPSILVLEKATLGQALVRSWRLTRRRFWTAFGVIFLINLIMGVASNVIAIPLLILSAILSSTVAPTGTNDTATLISAALTSLAPQLVVLVIQAVMIVVQCTGATLVYLDSRMRYEGLDQTLIAHLERLDLGATTEQLPDPFAVDPARAVTKTPPPRPAPPGYGPPAGWGAPGQPGPGGYGAAPYGQPTGAPYGQPKAQPGYGQPAPYGGPAFSAPPSGMPVGTAGQHGAPVPGNPAPAAPAPSGSAAPTPPAPPAPPLTPKPPTDSPWAPPGSGSA